MSKCLCLSGHEIEMLDQARAVYKERKEDIETKRLSIQLLGIRNLNLERYIEKRICCDPGKAIELLENI